MTTLRFIGLFSLLLGLICGFSSDCKVNAQVPDKLNESSNIRVVVPAIDGIVVWKEVAAALANTLHLDAQSLEHMFPKGNLNLRAPTTLLVLFSIDLALGDSMSVKMVDQDGDPALSINCDPKALGLMFTEEKPSEPVTVRIDDDWRKRAIDKPLVVCFHGLTSHPSKFDDFREFLHEHGFASAAIGYDDHQSMIDSASQINQLAVQLFAGAAPHSLVLVGHSMGGLVAREWIENPNLNAENIARLITVGTPHRGSNWASLPPLLDLFAEGSVDTQDLVDVILHKPSAPGLRELAPESKFLTNLAERPRRPGTSYTTVVGIGSPITEKGVRNMRTTLQRLDQEGSVLRLVRPRIQPLLQSFDELIHGKGDGVVAADRATIDGVEDVVQVDINHIDMFRAPPIGKSQPVWQAILERLK